MTLIVNLNLFNNHIVGFEAGVSNQPTKDPPKPFDFDFFGWLPGQQQGPLRVPATVPGGEKKSTTEFKKDTALAQPPILGGPTRKSATVPRTDSAQRVVGFSQGSNKTQEEDAIFFLNFVAIYEYRLKRQETSRDSKDQLEDLKYLKKNFKKFTEILKENVSNKVNFIGTLEKLPTDDNISRVGRINCIIAAGRYLNNPNQKNLLFQLRTIEERIEKLKPKKPPSKIEIIYPRDSGRSPQMEAVIAERRHASRVARQESIDRSKIDLEELVKRRRQHQIDTNPNPFMYGNNILKISTFDSVPPHIYYESFKKSVGRIADSVLNGINKIENSDAAESFKYMRKHALDKAAQRAKPSSVNRNSLSYSFFERFCFASEEGGGRGGGR